MESDHIQFTPGSFDSSGYPGIGSRVVYTNSASFNLSSIDSFSKIVMVVNTHDKSAKTHKLGIAFVNDNSLLYMNSYVNFSFSDTTVSDSIRELSVSITDTQNQHIKRFILKRGHFILVLIHIMTIKLLVEILIFIIIIIWIYMVFIYSN